VTDGAVFPDADNPIVRLCAAGMAIEGDTAAARELFSEAWALHRDDYEACIAAHYLARHQTTAEDTLRWNAVAVHHAEAVADGRVNGFLASLYLNLAESHRVIGDETEAIAAADRARQALVHLPAGGYRDFVAGAIARLDTRLGGQHTR